MSTFIQLHLLTSYPPANLNRDDLGRPKTAFMGGAERLRVSSQSLKRHWRTSDLFQEALAGNLGIRTKRLGLEVMQRLLDGGVAEGKAKDWAGKIADVFGKLEKDSVELSQLAHISPEERQAVDTLTDALIEEKRAPKDEELNLLRKNPSAADIGLFGRMLADDPAFNVEAACQVAHAITVHPVVIEDDYFTAVDDLNSGDEDRGAAHIGETGFAAGLFYSYVCINRDQLIDNLRGDAELADKAIAALAEAAIKVSPTGKQNSFGSRAYASYVMAEKGTQQPRSLSVAFLKPVQGQDQAAEAIAGLEEQARRFDQVYGDCADKRYSLNAHAGEGSFQELMAFLKND
ncbi:MAG: type I-E CRISPR-associated protein Cas7/Cse4/CasC [Alcanivorax sp.]|jgi:CRISPR system Cascade subunit CasC|nr:type I-E CRISPR-associated protein Cas7/Cse4/CasC [Alcanivorax sp.]HAR60044.1 type I-E CRISPR-associated protein Cas7/Cse4/CasC [Alcanivorax sp.]HCI11344.1 type I-E CRISPR-associated protein Cas7/Cse4/CasC [Alcanivorax sp.]|tara:strand:- start:42715 stop:43752 length:1038 start_codon:yes stop_codon:yes gene_type:complete